MSTDRAKQVRELFEAALERDEGDRTRFLEQACPDAEIRADVSALIAADARSAGFLEPPTQAPARVTPFQAQSKLIGENVGSFEIVRLIGVGGMGTVYEARQREPRRRVALKLMRPDLSGGALTRRFKLEADILGRLRHPGIAQIYQAGEQNTLGGGLPYFAMEFVEGACSITDYARNQQLSDRAKIEIFTRVCDAVTHGHQRGVIHRDLKPGNILVDATGQTKLIDFGVARPIGSGTLIATMHTNAAAVVGTLQYMSPEQSAGPAVYIDVRTDVYALGVVLYELLAGTLPFDCTDVSPFDVPRLIREREPQRITRHRPELRGDVETIVHKALAKDRERRYASVADFAADLRSYLHNEPIAARRDSGWYLLRKTLSRYRLAAVVAVSFVVLLAASAASLALLYRRAESRAEELRRAGYFNSVALAHAALEDENGPRLWQYLRACPDDLRGWEWDYLARRGDLSRRAWTAHPAGASVWCSPSGRWLATCAYEGVIRLWHPATGEEVLNWQAHEGPISMLAYSPDETRIASVGYDKMLRVWDVRSAAQVLQVETDSVRATSVSYAPDGRRIATGGFERGVKIWDADTGEPLAAWPAEHAVQALSYSTDGRVLYGCGETQLSMWAAASGELLATVVASERELSGFAVDHSGALVATGDLDQEVVLWDATTLARTDSFHVAGTPQRLAFSHDGDRLAVAAGALEVWEIATRDPQPSRVSDSRMSSCQFSPDGSVIFTGELSGRVRVWDAAPPQIPLVLIGHSDFVRGVVAYPDGVRIASASRDGTIRVWDYRGGETLLRWESHDPRDQYLAIDASGQRLISCGYDGLVRVWDADTGAALRTLRGHTSAVLGVACAPTGTTVASVSADRTVRLWDSESGALLRKMEVPGPLQHVAFAPSGSEIATAGWDGVVRVWSLRDGRERRALHGHDDLVIKVGYSPDGRLIVSCGNDTTVRIWDAATGACVRVLRGHSAPAQSLAFSHDGTRLFTGGYDQLLNVWDVADGTLIMTLAGHRGGVTDLAMAPDDRWIVSASNDQSLRVWRARSPD